MQPSLHATLEAVVRFPHDPLTADEAGQVLGRAGSTISAACKEGMIIATSTNVKGRGNVKRYRITKSNLIIYLWQAESGDKEMLRAAMRDLCPRILKEIETRERPAAARPRNIVSFDHPDLFRDPADNRQSA